MAQYLNWWSDARKFTETFLAHQIRLLRQLELGGPFLLLLACCKHIMQAHYKSSANCWYVRLCHVSLSLAPIGLRTASVWLFVQGASMHPSSMHPSRHKVAGLADQLTKWAEEAHVNKLPLVGSGHLKLTLANTGDMFRPCLQTLMILMFRPKEKLTWATWDSRCPPQTSRSSSLQLDPSHPQHMYGSHYPPKSVHC